MTSETASQPIEGMAKPAPLKVTIYDSFDELGVHRWHELWTRAEVPSVFARYEWLSAWWRVCADGRRLRLYVAHDAERPVAILPTAWPIGPRLATDPVILAGHAHADYAAILVDRERPDAFANVLATLLHDLPSRAALCIANVRSDSTHAAVLENIARRWWSNCHVESAVPCPRASIGGDRLEMLMGKQSLRKAAKKLARLGAVEVHHFHVSADILLRLDTFFAQHIERWSGTNSPSLFVRHMNRAVYREWAERLAPTGDLLYTEITLDGSPVACHFGFISEGDLIWYKPTYNIAVARASPGAVLLRELLCLAGTLGLSGVDFTRGDEPFKRRFADQERFAKTYILHVRTSKSAWMKIEHWTRGLLRRRLRRS